MRIKNKITNNLVSFATYGLIIFGLIDSTVAQGTKPLAAQEASPATGQEGTPVPDNIVTSSEAPAASPQEAKSASSSDASDATKATSATNVPSASSNAEPNTNGVVPTDPSMIPPPESTSADNSTSPMDPNAGSATETPGEKNSPVNSTESIEKKKHEIKVRYNEVRTQVDKEEALVALRQAADKATTTEGQRQTLRAYYELLFKRMKQVDPSLTERCDVMQGAYLRRVEQTGGEPTIPLHLPSGVETSSTNAPQATPPAPKEKPHKKRSTSNTTQ